MLTPCFCEGIVKPQLGSVLLHEEEGEEMLTGGSYMLCAPIDGIF